MDKIVLNVNGMVCNGCENRIQNAIQTVEGVEKVEANHTNGTVIIVGKEGIDQNRIEQIIEDIGFEVEE